MDEHEDFDGMADREEMDFEAALYEQIRLTDKVADERDALQKKSKADKAENQRLKEKLAKETKRANQAEHLVQYVSREAARLNISK